jgi:transposase
MLTDEQILDAFMEAGSQNKASQKLNMSSSAMRLRLLAMRFYGVEIPRLSAGGKPSRFTKERVAQLNEYIRQKTEGDNLAGQR